MLARITLITLRAAAGTVLSLILFTGCHHPAAPPAKPASTGAPPKVKFNPTYDAEIKEVMDLARKERWEEAQAKADALFQKAPQNAMVQRIHSWVAEARQKRREQALEDKIREIEASERSIPVTAAPIRANFSAIMPEPQHTSSTLRPATSK